MRRVYRSVLLSLAAVAALAAVSGATAADPAPGALKAGRAAIGGYGFDESGMDPSVRPGDDFNEYANGAWRTRTTIPPDRPYWGVWDSLEEQARSDVHEILEAAAAAHAAPGSNLAKLGDYYASYMDEKRIDALGGRPLEPQLKAIAAVRTYGDLATAFGRALRVGDNAPFKVFVFADLKNPDLNVAYIEQGGLGLPDRDYYLSDDANMATTRTAYQKYVESLLRLAGGGAPAGVADRARRVYELERRLAEGQWTRVELRDLVARYDVWPLADYRTKAPGFDWTRFFAAAGIARAPTAIASTNTAIQKTAALIPQVPLATWRDYLVVRAVDGHAPFLSRAYADLHFALHGTALAGTPEQPVRWKRASRATKDAMGEAIGELYVAKHFSPQAKAQATELVRNLLAAASRRIDALDWMSPATKARAHEKIAAFTMKIGYPDRWRDYSALTVRRGEAYENALAADRFEYERNLAKVGRPVDRSEWDMTPMEINAYYDPTRNHIVFPAAVLQPPFFDMNADPAVNYGGIGAIIGHEISHGFDDQGRLFDGSGTMSDWWTPADADAYQTRTDALVRQYSEYEALPGLKVNGKLTLGENIADNAGLVLAYDAYHRTLGADPAPVIDGRTGDQRFFLAYAQDWRTLSREEVLREAVATDPHSPDPLRVRTVRNFDPWYAAFDVRRGERLYVEPADRVRIW